MLEAFDLFFFLLNLYVCVCVLGFDLKRLIEKIFLSVEKDSSKSTGFPIIKCR